MYYCEKCKEEITSLSDALVLKICNSDRIFVKGVVLHKGDCDDAVSLHYRNQGMEANATMTLEFLHEHNSVEKYRITGILPEFD